MRSWSNKFRSRTCTRCGAKSSEKDTTFHRFPKVKPDDFELAQKWAQWCYPNQDWSSFHAVNAMYTSHRMLCGDHFADGLIFKSGKLRKRTIPSVDPASTPATSYLAPPAVAGAEVLENSTVEHLADKPASSLSSTSLYCTKSQPQYNVVSGTEHNYCRHISFDHTYCAPEPRIISGSSHQYESRNLKPRTQESVAPAPPAETYSTSTHPPFDYECVRDSPASVKSEYETAESWYREAAPRVCRVCLRVGDDEADMASLLHREIWTPLAHTLQHLIPDVQISPGDPLPKQLCGACADDAVRAEHFVNKARRAQRRLAGLDLAAVAEDLYQSSLLSRYLPSSATAPDQNVDEAFVSLRFDGEHLEVESTVETDVNDIECIDETIDTQENACDIAQTMYVNHNNTSGSEKCEDFVELYEEIVAEADEKVAEPFEEMVAEPDEKIVTEPDEKIVTEPFEEIVDEPYEKIIHCIQDYPSIQSYLTFNDHMPVAIRCCTSEEAQPPESPSTLLTKSSTTLPAILKRSALQLSICDVCVPASADYDLDQESPSLPVKRRRRKSPLVSTTCYLHDNADDEVLLEELSTQRLCKPAEDDSSLAASWSLYDRADVHAISHVRVKEAERLIHPVLTCAHCGYKTRLKSKLRQHMRTRHDRRRAPRLRPRGTRRAES